MKRKLIKIYNIAIYYIIYALAFIFETIAVTLLGVGIVLLMAKYGLI